MMAVLEPLGQIFTGVLLMWGLVTFSIAAINVLIILILAIGDFMRDIRDKIFTQWMEVKRARGAR